MAGPHDGFVVLGEVVGPYGVRGWLKAKPHSEAPDALLKYSSWWLKMRAGGEWREYRQVAGRMHSGTVLVQLAGVESREAAAAMKGFEIGVPRSALPAPAEGEFYWTDLEGLAVRNRAGILLGTVSAVAEFGAHPVLRVTRPPGKPGPERLIPWVPEIVGKVDLEAGAIEVDWGEDY